MAEVRWESYEWVAGAERYRFDILDHGLIGRVSVCDGRSFALPMVAWQAMLEAIKVERKARQRSDANLPARAGARWTQTESDELTAKFRSGRSIADLAREHARTSVSIEHQLERLGLWTRTDYRLPPARPHDAGDGASSGQPEPGAALGAEPGAPPGGTQASISTSSAWPPVRETSPTSTA